MAYTHCLSTQEAEAGGSQVWGHPGAHSETLSQNTNQTNKQTKLRKIFVYHKMGKLRRVKTSTIHSSFLWEKQQQNKTKPKTLQLLLTSPSFLDWSLLLVLEAECECFQAFPQIS
jgi:hypothetical protein